VSEHLSIEHYPIFEQGIFESCPELFDRFTQNTSDYLKKKCEQSREILEKYENTITWPVVTGPGIFGATHPGADNIFVNTIISSNEFIYNSDALYINPSKRIFAVSDPPGITTCSRNFFENLDKSLTTGSPEEVESLVNVLSKEMDVNDGATLSLLHFPAGQANRALVLVTGDTYLFKGNMNLKELLRIEGNPDFIGTPHACFKSDSIEYNKGDFFVIVSDGIMSIKGNNPEIPLEDIVLSHIDITGNENGAYNLVNACNQCGTETIYGRTLTRFGGNDNVTVLIIYPGLLAETNSASSLILGGNINKAQ